MYGGGYIKRRGFCQLLGAMGADTLQRLTESESLRNDTVYTDVGTLSVTLYTVPGGNLGVAPINPRAVLDSLRAQ